MWKSCAESQEGILMLSTHGSPSMEAGCKLHRTQSTESLLMRFWIYILDARISSVEKILTSKTEDLELI